MFVLAVTDHSAVSKRAIRRVSLGSHPGRRFQPAPGSAVADGHVRHGDQPGGAQQIAPFQQRVGDGGKVRLDPLQLAHDVELQAASLDSLAPCLDPRELGLGRGPLEFTEPLLFLHQAQGRVQVLAHEDGGGEAELRQKMLVHRLELGEFVSR